MTLHFPDIFEQFCCTGSLCEDNCCKIGWDIEIDKDTYSFYKSLDSELGRRLINSIYEEEGCLYMSQPRGCPFMNEQGLCSVQLAHGEEHISDICREHPRFYEWFNDYKEAGVGLCCEEVCRLICAHPKPILFSEKETDEEPDDLEFDPELLKGVKKIRDRIIDILQDRGFSLTERLGIILCAEEDIQQAVLDEDPHRLTQLSGMLAIDGFRIEIVNECRDGIYMEQHKAYRAMLDVLGRMEYIHPQLKELFETDDKQLEEILSKERLFDREYKDLSYELEHIAVYFIYRYLIKAVRDGAVTERLYMAVFCTLAVRLLFLKEYSEKNSLPETPRREWLIKEFSKEIEYSADNMDIIYEEIQEGCVTYSMLQGMLSGE